MQSADDKFLPGAPGEEKLALTLGIKKDIISVYLSLEFPRSRGVSGALYLQSATAGVLCHRGPQDREPPGVSGVDIRVSCNRSL